jgi:hypothetical protein
VYLGLNNLRYNKCKKSLMVPPPSYGLRATEEILENFQN